MSRYWRWKRYAAALADGADELRHEALARDVAHAHARVQPHHVLSDGEQQVGLAESHAAVDEQRVVDA